jgi:hypothetical protein
MAGHVDALGLLVLVELDVAVASYRLSMALSE